MIQTNPHGDGFIDTATGRRFVPVGTNYAAMLDMVHYRGQPVQVKQVGTRLFLRGLPVANPDRVAHVPVIKLECAARPRMPMDWSYEDPEKEGN